MYRVLCLLAVGLHLCLQTDVQADSRMDVIEQAVRAAKATVDNAYEYSRRESLDRVKRNAANPADVLRLLKQPAGLTRSAVRAADYMDVAMKLVKRSLGRRHRRSINATDIISAPELEFLAELTGCSPRQRVHSCSSTSESNEFRTGTSVCNNRQNTRWGAANTPFVRWLPAEYEDSISLPKGWSPEHMVHGHLLPLVREVSNRILRTGSVENDPLYSHLVTIFGQWTDHDLTFTPHSPVIRSFNNGIDCDQTCERAEPCFPIQIPETDPRFTNHYETCIPFFRSAPACGSGYTGYNFGASTVRQQMNSLTAFIDVGQVYGSDDVKAAFLRDLTQDKGLLRVNMNFTDNGRELLPFSKMDANMCATQGRITGNSNVEELPCFVAGDERTNENIALTSLHTLFMREHNRLVRALAELNPNWNGEKLYQEARKIMGGYFQVITFRDYLQHIVGPDFIQRQLSTYPGYDENIDPSISNVFATAAYRFAHLMVQPFVFRLDENYAEHSDYPSPLLHKAFFTPWRVITEGGLDPILRGLVGRPAKLNTQNKMMSDELRERLFKFSKQLALDLGSLNMQRGRDHGLPGYNQWRRFCGLSEPRTLAELSVVMNNTDLAEKLLGLYGTPDNIDVWLAGVAEPFVRGGRVGPLFACLIATQFQRIREGDRLWWENDGVFKDNQRMSLMKTSLARIICDNTGITEVPDQPFLYRPRGSGYTRCEDIPEFDLSPWKEGGPDGKEHRPSPVPPIFPNHKVAFSVRLGRDTPPPDQVIVFLEEIYNGQDSYNNETGKFTCPEAGVYEFQFHCTIFKNAGNIDLMHNGKLVLHSFTTRQRGFITASGNIYLKLKEGDEVYLKSNFGDRGLTSDSFFSGHLLFTE